MENVNKEDLGNFLKRAEGFLDENSGTVKDAAIDLISQKTEELDSEEVLIHNELENHDGTYLGKKLAKLRYSDRKNAWIKKMDAIFQASGIIHEAKAIRIPELRMNTASKYLLGNFHHMVVEGLFQEQLWKIQNLYR